METSIRNVEIAIVGAGHGGLVTAIHLATMGYDVQVFEKQSEDQIGYDWHDAIDPKVFKYIDIPDLMEDIEYSIILNHRYIFPEQKKPMNMNLPAEERSWSIHRKTLLKKLLKVAKNAGVSIHYEIDILKPLIEDDSIQGIITSKELIRAKLIIDNAGLFTPIRTNLPESYNITRKFKRGQIFYTYRAYFNILEPINHYTMHLGLNSLIGIAWLNAAPESADILIGSIDKLSEKDIITHMKSLRYQHKSIGETLKLGGSMIPIPVRRPLSKIVGTRYVVIGAAAAMASPICGSGVGPSMKAGKILADTILQLDRSNTQYNTEDLWSYQTRFFKEIGFHLAQEDLFKGWLMSNFNDMKFIFGRGIISEKDLMNAMRGLPTEISISTMIIKVLKGISRLEVLLRLKSLLSNGTRVLNHFMNPPLIYSHQSILEWQELGEEFFKEYELLLQSSE